jgi:hypothetical protein
MHALDGGDVRDAARLQPIEEFDGGARIGAARVWIAASAWQAPSGGRSTFEHDYANAAPPFARKFAGKAQRNLGRILKIHEL